MASKRRSILQAVDARLATITEANGFATDAGLTRFVGEAPTLGADDPPAALALIVGAAVLRWQGKKCYVSLPIEIHVLAPAGDAAWLAQEDALADVKRALEVDHDLGGLLDDGPFPLQRGGERPLQREPGSTEVGAVLPYELHYTEGWGTP
jgi:hypothetical protein